MPVDTSIYGQIQQPQPVNALANLAQAYQIRGLQNSMDRADREEAQQNRLLQLVGGQEFSGMDTAGKARALQGIGAFSQAGELIKSEAAANKDARAADSSSLDMQLKRLDAAANIAGSVNDQASYDRGLQLMRQIGFDTSKFNPAYDPAGVQQFAQATLAAKDRLANQTQQQGQAITMRGQDMTAQTARQGQELTRRGQDMTDTRAREFNETKVEENRLKREEKAETANMTKASQVASFDTMLGTLDRLSKHPGLSRSVGLTGKLPTMPGSDSANFQAELDTFQSQAFVPMVAQLKGMGALSDAEGRKLTQAVGALNPNMGEKAFRESIDRIMSDMEQARQRVVGKAGAAGEQGATPKPASTTRKVVGGKTYENDGKGWYLVN